MRHARSDYEAIQPWPTKRPHTVKQDGQVVFDATVYRGDPPYDPIIPDDEPVFILRAKDVTAPEVVRYWCDVQDREGGDETVTWRIRRFAEEMEAYGQEHGAKMPDTPHELLAP